MMVRSVYGRGSAEFTADVAEAPHARARVYGSEAYPAINGQVDFYQTDKGVIVLAEMGGLPYAGACGVICRRAAEFGK